jgi:hypothetical protein
MGSLQRNPVIGNQTLAPSGKLGLKPPRVPKPPNREWPHLNFLEELTQWGCHASQDEESYTTWMQSNDDFNYCEKHEVLTEMVKLHPSDHYNTECSQCLKQSRSADESAILTAFFAKQHLSIKNLPEAEAIWMGLFADREVVRKKFEQATKERMKPLATIAAVQVAVDAERDLTTCSRLERSAFLWYYFLAWEKTRYRIAAIKENAMSPGNSGKFNMLPKGADEDLVKFNSHCRVRGAKTAAGRSGQKTYNTRPCNVHPLGTGHMIHGYNVDRYAACGICVKPQETSITQRIMDDLAASGGFQHPAVQFAAPKAVPSRHGKFRGPSAAAAAKLTTPVQRTHAMSLEDEAEMN